MRVKVALLPHDGEEVECEMLVCVLPYSNLIYYEAQLNQRQESYIKMGLAELLLYIGKKPKTIISDNLKTVELKADKYEAELTNWISARSRILQTSDKQPEWQNLATRPM